MIWKRFSHRVLYSGSHEKHKSAHSKTFHVVNKHPDPLLKAPPSVRWDGILWNLLSGNPCAFQAVGGRTAKATTSTRAGPVDSRHKLSNWGLQRSGNPDIPWAPLTSRLTAASRKKLDSNQKPTQCLRCYMDRETSVERRQAPVPLLLMALSSSSHR